MNKQPIMIQGALQSEIDLLLEHFKPYAQNTVGGCVFYECSRRNLPIVISKTKMGEIAAAIATTVGIEHYRPAWILNQGTAGACDPTLCTGDVIVGERVAYLSQYATKKNKETDTLNPWKREGYLSLDGEAVSLSADRRLLDWIGSLSLSIAGNLHFGVLGSGDVWTTERDAILDHRARLGALCESMECTGVYMAASMASVPAVSVRVISNNELIGEVYEPKCGQVAQSLAVQLVDAWIDSGARLPF